MGNEKEFRLDGDDLECLNYEERENPQDRWFPPARLHPRGDVETLAFRKQAILAGVPNSDEKRLIANGRLLWEEKER